MQSVNFMMGVWPVFRNVQKQLVKAIALVLILAQHHSTCRIARITKCSLSEWRNPSRAIQITSVLINSHNQLRP